MAPNKPPSNNLINDQLSLDPAEKEVPAALSMMVDSMTNMIQRARKDLERLDQKAREDHEKLRMIDPNKYEKY